MTVCGPERHAGLGLHQIANHPPVLLGISIAQSQTQQKHLSYSAINLDFKKSVKTTLSFKAMKAPSIKPFL
jgi:hypothetical protein